MIKHIVVLTALLAAPVAVALAQTPQAPAEENKPVDWEHWKAHNSVADAASLQRGARNFMNYCIGCHSLKYMRYQRMAEDLKIPKSVLTANLLQPGASALDYITTPMPPKDAEAWFGKVPPDLSLIARSKGPDYIYRFLKTFFEDPSRPTGTDNLALPSASMPAVISDLEGVKKAVFLEQKSAGGGTDKVFERFETVSPGNMTPEEYDGFVRDTVNFLDYVGEPAQVERRSMGVWVVLFLLALTALAYLLKQEYWKDVH
jgi:ubiquinol-cytochrome c reductase cytochrome c1 subunit